MSSKSRVVVGLAILAIVIMAGGTRPDAQAKAYQETECPASGAPGSLDPCFGTGGIAEFPFAPDVWSGRAHIDVQPDGGILVLDRIEDWVNGPYSALRRFDSTGAVEKWVFEDVEVEVLPLPLTTHADPETPRRVIVVPDLDAPNNASKFDIIVVANVSLGWRKGRWDIAVGVARLNADGSFVEAFGENTPGDPGRTIFHFAEGERTWPKTAIVDSDGRVVVVGASSQRKSGERVALARLDAYGTLDPEFGDEGRVVSVLGFPHAIAQDGLGGLVVAANGTGDHGDGDMLIRFDENGAQDMTFGYPTGIVETGIETGDGRTLAIDKRPLGDGGGRILVAGNVVTRIETGGKGKKGKPTVTFERDVGIAAFFGDGSADPSFGIDDGIDDGIFSVNLDGERDDAEGVSVDSAGRIVFAVHVGYDDPRAVVIRLDENGSPDSSFGIDGIVSTDLGDFVDYTGLVLTPRIPADPNDPLITPVRIVVFGALGWPDTYHMFVARYLQ